MLWFWAARHATHRTAKGRTQADGGTEWARRPIMLDVFTATIAVAVMASVGWRLSGGTMFTIATPSMCPDLCVGTLVLDRPLHGPLEAGMVVTFRPPGSTTVYTHRVTAVLGNGEFRTAGDALGVVDPWTVPRARVVGVVVAGVRDLGWLWRSLPSMSAALACYLCVRRRMTARARVDLDPLAVTLFLVVPVLVLRPLLRAAIVAWRPVGRTAVLHIVNSGLLPSEFRITGAPVVGPVNPGALVRVVASPGARGISLSVMASIPAWQWAVVGLIVALPMIGPLGRLLLHPRRTGAPMPIPVSVTGPQADPQVRCPEAARQ